MSVLVGKDSRVIVQGFTGKEGSFHAQQMIDYGTNIVGGVTPKKGGQTHLEKPIFNTVAEAVQQVYADTSIIFVPPPVGADAIAEAAFAGIQNIICITEGIPTQDMIIARQVVHSHGATLIGPNCPGIITPGEAKVGIMPSKVFSHGSVGVISRSGTLTYEAVDQITKIGMGQSSAIGIGGDPIIGISHIDAVKLFENDPDTDSIVIIGEIGGSAEEEAAKYIKYNVTKPVVAFIAGSTAPRGRRMGHAGAIISGGKGTAQEKKSVLSDAGITVVDNPAEIGKTLSELVAS